MAHNQFCCCNLVNDGDVLARAYSHTYGFKATIYHLANIVGPRSKHGVIYDFIQKLETNPKELEMLADGTQDKSYPCNRLLYRSHAPRTRGKQEPF